MKFGFSKKDITPDHAVYMAGYSRQFPSTGVLDPIEINTCILNDGLSSFVLCLVDSIIMEDSVIKPAKRFLSKKYGLKNEQIVIGCIHTHSAPAYFKLYYEDTHVETSLQKELISQIIECVEDAFENMKEAECRIEKATIQGLYGNRNKMNGYSDKDVYSFHLSKDGIPFATLLHMACHPTILDGSNYYLSADLFGWIRQKLYRQSGIPVMIMNGCTGDVSTRFYREKKGIEELERVSSSLVSQLTQSEIVQAELGPMHFLQVKAEYPFDAVSDEWTQNEIKRLQKIIDTNPDAPEAIMSEQLLKNLMIKCCRSPMTLHLTSHIISCGQVLFISLPGDITAELGRRLQDAFPDHLVIPVCYCENYSNYFVCEEDYGKFFETYISRMPKGGADDFIRKIIAQTRYLLSQSNRHPIESVKTYPLKEANPA